MSRVRIIGILVLLLGIFMFGFGITMFSWAGPLNPIISKLGMYSFFLWLPTIITGIVLIFQKTKRKLN
jgi:hypothetical protein